ncbi:protein HASTY 1-like [Pyrus ussuriensis x Pyrus communis]|uniref:Protein HASTY 1-like n=1 Tax=Pyrus ussuriensis x Pyrus communis TaxID=2448454 RepID=A0A5N5HI87_9ROSA|nr:protein HASTY 1-like [Pyrus ussuriensis x Pyrus communis]
MLRLKGIRDQLISAGEKISDNDYIIVVLSGLPTDFEVIKTVILARDSIMSLKDFRAQLLGAEASIEARIQVFSNSMSTMYVQGDGAKSSNSQGGDTSSNFQEGRRHTAPNCYNRANNNGQPSNFVVCQIYGKKGHIALECYHKNNFLYQGNPPPPSLTALSTQTNMRQPNTNVINDNGFNDAETWILDTGATHHMTANYHRQWGRFDSQKHWFLSHY